MRQFFVSFDLNKQFFIQNNRISDWHQVGWFPKNVPLLTNFICFLEIYFKIIFCYTLSVYLLSLSFE